MGDVRSSTAGAATDGGQAARSATAGAATDNGQAAREPTKGAAVNEGQAARQSSTRGPTTRGAAAREAATREETKRQESDEYDATTSHRCPWDLLGHSALHLPPCIYFSERQTQQNGSKQSLFPKRHSLVSSLDAVVGSSTC